MPSTFVHGILPSSCLLVSRLRLPILTRIERAKLLAASAFIANMPDLDIIPAALHPALWRSIHRSWGHNIFSLTLWAFIAVFVLLRWVCPRFSKAQAWTLAAGLLASHVLLDAMGAFSVVYGRRFGVPLLYPFSDWELILPIPLFKAYRLQQGVHPLLGHILSADFWRGAVVSEIYGSLLIFILWTAGVRALSAIGETKKISPPQLLSKDVVPLEERQEKIRRRI